MEKLQTFASWQTKEFEERQKGSGWFITFFILAVIFIGYEVITRDYFAAITFLIIAVVLYWFAKMPPRDVTVTITDKNIALNDYVIPYVSIKRFWIVDHSRAKALHLETSAYLNRFIVILLGDQDPNAIHSILINFVQESQPNKESVAYRIARRLRF